MSNHTLPQPISKRELHAHTLDSGNPLSHAQGESDSRETKPSSLAKFENSNSSWSPSEVILHQALDIYI